MKKVLFCHFILITILSAQSIHSKWFKSEHAHEGFTFPEEFSAIKKPVNFAIKHFSEAAVVNTVLSSAGLKYGMALKEVKELREFISVNYDGIKKDDDFNGVNSVVKYNLSTEAATEGHYFMYIPKKVTDKTPKLLFLHDYGGNLKIYLSILKRNFSTSIIIIPSMGPNWKSSSMPYIDDCLKAIKINHKIEPSDIYLMGLSYGATAGFELYLKGKDKFKSYISLAANPWDESIKKYKAADKLIMINAIEDKYVDIDESREIAKQFKDKLDYYKFKTIRSNHFFFISKEKQWTDLIKVFTTLH